MEQCFRDAGEVVMQMLAAAVYKSFRPFSASRLGSGISGIAIVHLTTLERGRSVGWLDTAIRRMFK